MVKDGIRIKIKKERQGQTFRSDKTNGIYSFVFKMHSHVNWSIFGHWWFVVLKI